MNSILFSLPKYRDMRTELGLWNTPKNHLKKVSIVKKRNERNGKTKPLRNILTKNLCASS